MSDLATRPIAFDADAPPPGGHGTPAFATSPSPYQPTEPMQEWHVVGWVDDADELSNAATPLLVAMLGVIILAIVIIAVVALKPSGAPPKVTSTSAPPASVQTSTGRIYLTVPEGWAKSNDGQTIAQSAADLTAAIPSGPRARILPTGADPLPDLASLATDDVGGSVYVGIDPATTNVANRNAVSVVVVDKADGGRKTVQGYVIVPLGGGTTAIFLLEAPLDQWPAAKTQLGGTIGVR